MILLWVWISSFTNKEYLQCWLYMTSRLIHTLFCLIHTLSIALKGYGSTKTKNGMDQPRRYLQFTLYIVITFNFSWIHGSPLIGLCIFFMNSKHYSWGWARSHLKAWPWLQRRVKCVLPCICLKPTYIRVSKVVAHHKKLLTQWRYI